MLASPFITTVAHAVEYESFQAAKTDDHDLVLTNPVVIKFNFKLKKIRK